MSEQETYIEITGNIIVHIPVKKQEPEVIHPVDEERRTAFLTEFFGLHPWPAEEAA